MENGPKMHNLKKLPIEYLRVKGTGGGGVPKKDFFFLDI